MNRSCQKRLWLLLRISTVRTLWQDSNNKKVEFATEKTLKGGQKKSAQREGHEGQASRVKNFRRAGDVKNDTAGL